MSYTAIVQTPIGGYALTGDKYGLVSVEKTDGVSLMIHPDIWEYYTQVIGYFEGTRKRFEVPTIIAGTHFQLQVWKAIQRIPYGEMRSYKQIAETIGKPKAFRAVAQACKKNPLPIIVPCHRVVATQGLGGYNGGIETKRFLLKLEGANL